MSSGDKPSTATIGFYTVVVHEQHGLFGGLLLVNDNARPVEFHCTLPVKPNRAQEILYGATLPAYLYGEAIGRTLLAKVGRRPEFVCVDLPAALAVREFCDAPVALVLPDEPSSPVASLRIDEPHAAPLHPLTLGVRCAAVHRRFAAEDEPRLIERLRRLPEHFDLSEPFARIRGAIEEAQRGSR